MGDLGLPVLIMGRGAWQKLADPAALQSFSSKFGEMTLITWAIVIASVFVVFSLSLSFYLLFEHLSGYNEPQEQKWLIGIILMVPVYTITSVSVCIIMLFFNLDLLQNFGRLLRSVCVILFWAVSHCLLGYTVSRVMVKVRPGRTQRGFVHVTAGGEEMAVHKLAKQGAEEAQEPLLDKETGPHEIVHPLPLRWLTHNWTLGRSFHDSAKFGIVQYIIIKVSCSWVAFILNLFDLYGEGEFDFSMGYPYITIIQNFSQMWALYCLIQFYYVTKHELHEINPLAKFLCFKAVVFVTWWQGVVIALLFTSGVAEMWIPGHPSGKPLDVLQSNLQNFVICIEMAVAAVAHIYVYPAAPYRRENNRNLDTIDSFAIDLEEDIEIAATSVKDSVKDVVMGGGENIVEDVKMTVTQAVEPVGSGFTHANEKFQNNVSKMNDKLQDNVSKIQGNIHENVFNWSGRKSEEVVKEGEYLVKRDNREDDEIVQTEERFRLEQDESPRAPNSDAESGVLKEEVSGTTTSRSANEDVPGEETISFTQQKEMADTSERKTTSTQTKETDNRGRLKKDESMNVRENYELNNKGDVASKDIVARTVARNGAGRVVKEDVTEEQEERDESGHLLKKVKRDGKGEETEEHLQDER